MKDIYRIKSTDLRIEGIHEIFIPLERTLRALEINFYLVGAIARDVMTLVHKEKLFTATADMDIAVMVSSIEEYERLKIKLIIYEDFEEDKNEPYRLYRNKKAIDLLPFGKIETKKGTVTLEARK